MVRRFRRLGGIVLALAGLATACSHATTHRSTAGSVRTTPAERRASKLADAINLTDADTRGFTGVRHRVTAQDRVEDDRMARCAGATPPSEALVDVYSDDYKAGPQQQLMVSSDVQVMPTVRQVRRDLSAIRSPRAAACFQQEFARLFGDGVQGVTLSGFRMTPFHVSKLGTDGTFAFHLSMTASSGTRSMETTGDMLGFAEGRMEVTLLTWGLGSPFPAELEGHYFRLLADRAVAQAD